MERRCYHRHRCVRLDSQMLPVCLSHTHHPPLLMRQSWCRHPRMRLHPGRSGGQVHVAEFGAGREYIPTRSQLLQPGRSAGRSVTLRSGLLLVRKGAGDTPFWSE